MSDDAADLDVVEDGVHWYVEGGGGRRFATKGEAVAYAWTLTIPGGVRPSVKMRPDVVRAPEPKPEYEVKVMVDESEDEVAWTAVGDILSASWRSAPTVTIELTAPVLHGTAQEMMLETVRNALHGEARARGLELISDASLEMFTDGMRADMKIRATARARARD